MAAGRYYTDTIQILQAPILSFAGRRIACRWTTPILFSEWKAPIPCTHLPMHIPGEQAAAGARNP